MLSDLGASWLADQVEALTDKIVHVSPSEFNEEHRYLPESVSSIPGPLRFEVNPFMREIVDCCDVDSPVREVNLKKGVQITYTTVLECILLYFMAHVKTLPLMYITADKELAAARIENNILPMLEKSGFADIIRSSDTGNSRKTGKTAAHLQFQGGGYLVPFGAKNATKMRAVSICVMLKDEIDDWPLTVGKDGDPDALTDARLSGYWSRRKIFRGSTPLIRGISAIDTAYLRGDQRKYLVLCKACSFPQELRWEVKNKETGEIVGGFKWDVDEHGMLILESVRWCCANCGEAHFEHDKERLFSPNFGAHWHPTATAVEPGIRSYHLPAMYSPIGMQPWYRCVSLYRACFDIETRKVTDVQKYQVFYNNILAESFKVLGSRVSSQQVSAHRRAIYRFGEIPNKFAMEYSGSPILFLTCTVDVHKSNLAVAVFGWTKGGRSYLIDYWRFEVDDDEDDCSELSSPVWGRLRGIIEGKQYTADDGKVYKVILTFVDAGYANDTVTRFCAEYESSVYPILGRARPAKNQKIKEFDQFKTQVKTVGYTIVVDHYKDRIAPVLRREWGEEAGPQDAYHWNAPVDATDKQLVELTRETRREKTDERGLVSYEWYRPGNARNELWDLTCYAHAAVDILAWSICIEHFELENIEWDRFWEYLEENKVYFSE